MIAPATSTWITLRIYEFRVKNNTYWQYDTSTDSDTNVTQTWHALTHPWHKYDTHWHRSDTTMTYNDTAVTQFDTTVT